MSLPLWLHHAIENYGYWAVLLAIAIESTGIPFPGETALVATAVYAGTTSHLNIVLVVVAAAAGAILGDNFGFLLGHYGGYPLLKRIVRVLHVNPRALDYAQDYFARHGSKTVFLGRFFALLRAYAAFLAGANRMHWRTFLVWNAAGGITWAIVYGTLGFVLGRNLPLLHTVLRLLGVGGVIGLVVFIGVIGGAWYMRRRREQGRLLEQFDAQPSGAHASDVKPNTSVTP